MDLQERLETVRAALPAGVELVAVTKTHPIAVIQQAYDLGLRAFGENKVQELCAKQEVLPGDIRWHMIGHLQRNKVKYIAPFVHLIHSVDSDRLLDEISKQGQKTGRVLDCLLQVHIAREETKFGLDADELDVLISAYREGNYPGARIRGLMGMATFTQDTERISAEFRGLKIQFDTLRELEESFDILSMGMSGDYPVAIAQGSNMVRLGSTLFGERGTAL